MPLFAHFFMLDAAVRYGRPVPHLIDRQRESLMQRDWPGNVRELRNVADRFVLGVTEGVVELAGGAGQALKERVEQFECAVIADTLTLTGGAVAPRPIGCMSARPRCTRRSSATGCRPRAKARALSEVG